MNAQHTPTLRITPYIANEYQVRSPDFIPSKLWSAGTHSVTVEEVKRVADDADFNSDPRNFDFSESETPLGQFSAYRALAKQSRDALAKAQGERP